MRTYRTSRPGQQGFTLLEVFVSITILAISIVAITRMFGVGTRMSIAAEEQTLATILARSKMSEVLLLEQMDEGDSDSGSFKEFGGDYRYEVKIEEIELNFLEEPDLNFDTATAASAANGEEEPNFKTFHVTVMVKWNDNNKQLTMETLRTDYVLPESNNN